MVLVSSVAAFTSGLVVPNYTASKAVLIGLTRALAAPLAARGVPGTLLRQRLSRVVQRYPEMRKRSSNLLNEYRSDGSATRRRLRRQCSPSYGTLLLRTKPSRSMAACTLANIPKAKKHSRYEARRPTRRRLSTLSRPGYGIRSPRLFDGVPLIPLSYARHLRSLQLSPVVECFESISGKLPSDKAIDGRIWRDGAVERHLRTSRGVRGFGSNGTAWRLHAYSRGIGRGIIEIKSLNGPQSAPSGDYITV